MKKPKTEKPLPCPICGAKPRQTNNNIEGYFVECSDDALSKNWNETDHWIGMRNRPTKKAAIAAWNEFARRVRKEKP